MGQPERFDVVVVGVRGSGPQAVTALAAAMERRLGIPKASIQVALERGGVEAHKDIPKSEAITLARTLQELGAVVDVRASRREHSSLLTLEPDAEAAPSGAPPAPPPFQAGAEDDDRDLVSLTGLDAEPARTIRPHRSPTGEVDTSRPQGQPVHVEPERPFDADRKPRRASQPGPPTPRSQDSQRVPVVRDTPSGGVAVPRRESSSRPPNRESPPQGVTAPTRRPEPPRPPTPAPPRFAPPLADAKIELDLAAVGRTQAPLGTSALARGRSESSGTRSPSESSGTSVIDDPSGTKRIPAVPEPVAARSGGGFPSPMEPSSNSSTRVPVIPAPNTGAYAQATISARHAALAPPAGLLSPDRITSALMGLALATLVGIAIAYGWVRRDAMATSERLEGELREAVADPIGVDEGRRRAPQVVADELATLLDEQRGRYLQIWALVALPLGLAFGLLKRRSA